MEDDPTEPSVSIRRQSDTGCPPRFVLWLPRGYVPRMAQDVIIGSRDDMNMSAQLGDDQASVVLTVFEQLDEEDYSTIARELHQAAGASRWKHHPIACVRLLVATWYRSWRVTR